MVAAAGVGGTVGAVVGLEAANVGGAVGSSVGLAVAQPVPSSASDNNMDIGSL